MDNPKLAKIEIITDGGPWATHNFPCPVCRKRVAILNLNTGVFEPCAEDRKDGWMIVRWRHKRWEQLTRWLRSNK